MTPSRILSLLAALAALVAPAPDARGQGRPIALKGATIETVGAAGRIESGVIVLRDGKIEAVGEADAVAIPEDARVVDASERTLMPGIVEPAYPYRGAGGSSGASGSAIIGGRVVTLGGSSPTRTPSFTRVADGFDPFRGDFARLLRSGLTHLDLVPADYGQSAVIRVVPDDPDGMLVERDGRLYVSVSNSTASLEVVRRGLEAARRAGGGGGGGGGGRGPAAGGPGGDRPGGPPGQGQGQGQGAGPGAADASRGLWRAVVEGKAPLIADASGAAAILYLLDALEGFPEVRLALVASGGDAFLTLDRLADRGGVTLLLRPAIAAMPNSRDRINPPRIALERGIDLAFTRGGGRPGGPSSQDSPLFDVGYLIATGLPREAALEALTRRPAELVGLGDSLGRLEPGMSATLLAFDGDPFDPYSRLRTVIIDGRTVHEAD